jgi:hypothetical protein
MSTAYLPPASALPLWTNTKSRKVRARIYRIRSSGTQAPPPMLFWHALRAGGIGIFGPDQRLSEITAVEAVTEKPNKVAYSNARRALQLAELFEIEPTQVTASAEGGVALCFKIDGQYADIECFNSGEIWGIVSDRINPAKTWPIENSTSGIGRALLNIKFDLNA